MAGQVLGKVTANSGTHLISNTFYGTCETAAGTAAKIVKLSDTNVNAFTAITGMTLSVKFTNANSVASPTLTLQTNGGTQLLAAKNIYRYGTTAPNTSAASSWNAGSVVNFVYDGSYWQMVGWINNNDNTYPSVYVGTAAGTAAKVGTMTNGSLAKGYYCVSIVNTNTSAGAITLNINGKGAKAIYINGSASSSSNYNLTAGSHIAYYNGTNFYFRNDGKIPQLATSGSIGKSTASVRSGSGTSTTLGPTALSTTGITNGISTTDYKLDLTNVLVGFSYGTTTVMTGLTEA